MAWLDIEKAYRISCNGAQCDNSDLYWRDGTRLLYDENLFLSDLRNEKTCIYLDASDGSIYSALCNEEYTTICESSCSPSESKLDKIRICVCFSQFKITYFLLSFDTFGL